MPEHSPLISVQELSERLDEVTLLDVRWKLGGPPGREEFLLGHIPGASYVDLETDLADPPGHRGRHPLPDQDRFQAAMRRCGVSEDRPVVVYDAVAATSAARCWWLLRYHGHRHVKVLDGGYGRWVEDGGAVEQGEGSTEPGDFTARPGQLPVLDVVEAGRLAYDGVLLDARAPERYRGETEPIDPVAGHIPGAVNVPTAENLEGGLFKDVAGLDATYRAAGVEQGKPVGVYCGSGVTAAHDVLALEVLGIRASLYPGSWSEWVTEPSRKVASGPKP